MAAQLLFESCADFGLQACDSIRPLYSYKFYDIICAYVTIISGNILIENKHQEF